MRDVAFFEILMKLHLATTEVLFRSATFCGSLIFFASNRLLEQLLKR